MCFGERKGHPKQARRNPFVMAIVASISSFSGRGKMRAGKDYVRGS